MKKHLILATAISLALPFMASAVQAGPIERACMRSERGSGNRGLCGCIQQVADQTLRGGDQRRAASFFKDPDRAQDVKMSKRDADDSFWERYQAFGEQAEAYCAG